MACPLFRTKTSPEPTIWSGDLVITLPANSLAVKTPSRGTVLTAMFDMFYNDALSTKEFEFDFVNQVIYFIITDEISRNLVVLWVSIFTVSWCVRWCLALSDELLKAFVQPGWGQTYGRSPVWDRRWIFRFSRREKALLQPSNWKWIIVFQKPCHTYFYM